MDRPKRKYTVTDRVLAASRRNLVRANAVDKAIRYRMTPRRRVANYRNLVCAQTARRCLAEAIHRAETLGAEERAGADAGRPGSVQ